jgi:hypothetical protein
VWPQKTLLQWNDDLALLDQLQSDEIAARIAWRNAAALWQADLDLIQKYTRDVAGFGQTRFHNDPVKLALFTALETDARNRPDIYAQGKAAKAAWSAADPLWTFEVDFTVGAFGSLITAADSRDTTHGSKYALWRLAANTLNTKARKVDAENVMWYADATRKFAAGTTPGDTIRQVVPTTTELETPVGQAVISNVQVTDGEIRFNATAPNARRYSYLHQSPGSTAYLIEQADTTATSLVLTEQPAGLHRFKVFGSNSRGDGPESAVAEATVAQSGDGEIIVRASSDDSAGGTDAMFRADSGQKMPRWSRVAHVNRPAGRMTLSSDSCAGMSSGRRCTAARNRSLSPLEIKSSVSVWNLRM